MITNKPFRFWCQKVLPLVYDDSLSYYELLCKVVDFLNKLLEGEGELASAFNDLKEYVDTYFDNANFYQMIDDKLDEMAEDGTLSSLINQTILGSKITYCNTVNDLPTTGLDVGQAYQTGGYATVGDGGAVLYVIGDSDSGDGIPLATGFYANPVFLYPREILGSKISYCDTVNDLPTTGLAVGQAYQTGGYTTVGDGGGLIYVIGDSDGGHGIPLATGFYANPVFIYPYVTPEMFGAVGDGVADDTAAVQSAINNNIKTVVMIGTYRITAKLDSASNKRLYGLTGATLRWDNVVGATYLIGGSELSDIKIENIIFDFGRQLELRHSISLLTSSNLMFIGCVFKNSYGYATRFNASRNILIKDCSFEDITGAAGNPGGAIYGQDMTDLTVTGCRCKNLGDHFVYSGGVTEAKNIIISDCYMETCGVNNLTSGSAISLYANTHDVTIANCIFDTCREGIYAGVYSSYTTLPSKVSVSNCIFKNIILNGMTLFGISASNRIKQFAVDNCQIDTAGQDGISIRHAERFQMNNIIIDKSVRMGLEVSDTTASMFSQFQITENRDNGVLVGRGDTGASNYNIFSDFYITAATNAGSGAVGFYLRVGDYNVLNSIRVFSYPLNYRKGGVHNIWSNDSGEPSVTRSLTFTNDITEIAYHNVGDVVFNSAPTAGAPALWVCTAAGTPGTMKPVATLS